MRARSRIARLLAALVLGFPLAAAPGAGAAPTGYDVSYPLCGGALPAGAAFGVVGVNGGLANNANPCLAVELAWAAATPGLTRPRQPPASLYINTADPGNRVADWPTPVNASASASTPYGACDGSWSPACSYLYGLGRAAFSYALVASVNAGVGPAGAPWWLDIETVSSWAKAVDQPGWAAVNVAAIKGFVAGLRLAGATAPIGFYSTPRQWSAITGLDAASSPGQFPVGIPDWVAAGGPLSQVQAACQSSFSGGPVRLAQYAAGGLDGDYACPAAVEARLRILAYVVRSGFLRVSGTIAAAYRGQVTVELSATYRGHRLRRRGSGAAVHGRWAVLVPLPRHASLQRGAVIAQSSAGDGLLAGAASVRVRLG